jgi:hypothetical protein
VWILGRLLVALLITGSHLDGIERGWGYPMRVRNEEFEAAMSRVAIPGIV